MPSAHWSPVLRYLRRIAAPNQVGQTSDRVLLDRFVRTRDEEAFAALVKRHAAMVMAVCRRVLNDVHSAEDVFQATFLVLVQKSPVDCQTRLPRAMALRSRLSHGLT